MLHFIKLTRRKHKNNLLFIVIIKKTAGDYISSFQMFFSYYTNCYNLIATMNNESYLCFPINFISIHLSSRHPFICYLISNKMYLTWVNLINQKTTWWLTIKVRNIFKFSNAIIKQLLYSLWFIITCLEACFTTNQDKINVKFCNAKNKYIQLCTDFSCYMKNIRQK